LSRAMLEIVQLENGDVVLRRAGEEQKILLRLQFSQEVNEQLDGMKLEVAKAMIQGGAGAFADIVDEDDAEDTVVPTPIYH